MKKKYFKWRGKPPKHCEAIVFDPPKWKVEDYPKHPLKRNELVWFIGEIPNTPGHIIVIKRNHLNKDELVTMVHIYDFRKATDDEL